MDKQYFPILLFQTAGGAAGGGGPRCFIFSLRALALQFSFHRNPKVTFREGGALALVFYFKFADEIGPDQHALILFSVLACYKVPQTFQRHVPASLGMCCFLRNGF